MEKYAVILFSLMPISMALRFNKFHQTCGTNLNGSVISVMASDSKIRCALYCSHDKNCSGLSMNISELSLTGSTKCLLLTNIVASGVMSSENICVIMKEDSDKKIALTEMQTSQTPIETKIIIGAVEGLKAICNSNSGYDIGIISPDGVHVYDTFASLSQGPCQQLQYESIFPSGPAITSVEAIMTHQNDYVEIFANDQVWKWLMNTSPPTLQSGFPKSLISHLQSTTVTPSFDLTDQLFSNAMWGTNREKYGGVQRYFYTTGNTISYYYNIFPEHLEFSPSGGRINTQNMQNINIWSQLPANVADVCKDPENMENYIVFTNDGNHYQYNVNYYTDNNNPTVTSVHVGPVQY